MLQLYPFCDTTRQHEEPARRFLLCKNDALHTNKYTLGPSLTNRTGVERGEGALLMGPLPSQAAERRDPPPPPPAHSGVFGPWL